ncbi:hypothetical protein OEA41_000729 [Lepraria neglecta]|uniref:Uncharacterized protein n=1 Tax=Lepraria neglecta TaxID=209136 RepID=A0AAD9ZIZ4_9LECA|nr:hypothetical protein OEA41_000729 [Lepraria neglecta]
MNPPSIDLDHATIKPLPALPTEMTFPRPITPRRATAPDPSPTLSPFSSLSTTLPLRPRTRSPYARGHSRSRSSSGALSAPQMTRAHSSPMPNGTDRLLPRPSSPLGPPLRHRSPMRKPTDETFSSFGIQIDIDQTISENSELDLTPRVTTDYDSIPASPTPYTHLTFPRSRRRPASPLSQLAFGSSTPKNTLRACTSTPSLSPSQYNESYPSNYSYSSGSIPSTPTSLRSRSPSISSLETIPDSPDAEREAEEIARLKAAADREEQSEEGVRRRLSVTGEEGGLGRGSDKRKRWSVCGAERRGDLGLETIWEG